MSKIVKIKKNMNMNMINPDTNKKYLREIKIHGLNRYFKNNNIKKWFNSTTKVKDVDDYIVDNNIDFRACYEDLRLAGHYRIQYPRANEDNLIEDVDVSHSDVSHSEVEFVIDTSMEDACIERDLFDPVDSSDEHSDEHSDESSDDEPKSDYIRCGECDRYEVEKGGYLCGDCLYYKNNFEEKEEDEDEVKEEVKEVWCERCGVCYVFYGVMSDLCRTCNDSSQRYLKDYYERLSMESKKEEIERQEIKDRFEKFSFKQRQEILELYIKNIKKDLNDEGKELTESAREYYMEKIFNKGYIEPIMNSYVLPDDLSDESSNALSIEQLDEDDFDDEEGSNYPYDLRFLDYFNKVMKNRHTMTPEDQIKIISNLVYKCINKMEILMEGRTGKDLTAEEKTIRETIRKANYRGRVALAALQGTEVELFKKRGKKGETKGRVPKVKNTSVKVKMKLNYDELNKMLVNRGNVKDSSLTSYWNVLDHLYRNYFKTYLLNDNLDLLNDDAGVITFLREKYPNDVSFKTKLGVIVAILKKSGNDDIASLYQDDFDEAAKVVNTQLGENEKTEKEEEMWMDWVDIMKKVREGYRGVGVNDDEEKRNMKKIILNLYTNSYCPRRIKDYYLMKVLYLSSDKMTKAMTDKIKKEKEFNFIVVSKNSGLVRMVVFNNYKTVDTYGKIVWSEKKYWDNTDPNWFELKKGFNSDMKPLLVGKKEGDFLLGSGLTESSMSKLVSSTFKEVVGKPLNCNLLRKIFVSDNVSTLKTSNEKGRYSIGMGHSRIVQSVDYTKN